MTTIDVYLRFGQQVIDTSTESYFVVVDGSLGTSWGGTFQVQGLDGPQVSTLRDLYSNFIERVQQEGFALTSAETEPLRFIGSQLFLALPPIARTYIERAFRKSNAIKQPLAIYLQFEPTAIHLQQLPWELLHHPDQRFYFALHGQGIIRASCQPTTDVATLSFASMNRLYVWAESQTHQEDLARRRSYQPQPADSDKQWITGNNTWQKLLEQVDSGGTVDLLHVVAHGRSNSQTGDLEFAMTALDGSVEWIRFAQFKTLLLALQVPSVVYFDVCDSGSAVRIPGLISLEQTLANELLAIGVKVVIVMQDEIEQAAAGMFAESFYRQLVDGNSFAAAAAHARQMILLKNRDPVHWSIPALYMQAPQSKATMSWLDNGAEWFYDNAKTIFSPFTFLLPAFILVIARLSYDFSGVRVSIDDLSSLIAPMWVSVLIPLLAMIAHRPKWRNLSSHRQLNRNDQTNLLLQILFSTAVLHGAAWTTIGIFWFIAYHANVDASVFKPRVLQLVWSLILAYLALACYIGAYQTIRIVAMSVGRESLYLSRFLGAGRFTAPFLICLPAVMITFLVWADWPTEWIGTEVVFMIAILLFSGLAVNFGKGSD